MSNERYNNIAIPVNLDEAIEKGVSKALAEKNKNNKKVQVSKIAAASLVGVLTLGVVNPALASKIPFVGNVFESIEKNIYFTGNYSQYATSVNEMAYSNGIGVKLSEVVCDGQFLYATYVVENKKPFKYTYRENGKKLDMNQLILGETYNKVSFSNDELDTTGFSGLEGKFIDEYTFVGVQKYDLSAIKEEIPNEFMFKTKFIAIENSAINEGDRDDVTFGTWAFNVPVKTNKNLKNEILVKDVENDIVKINSVSVTPFNSILKATYKKGDWSNYEVKVLDENNKELSWDKITPSKDNDKEISVSLESVKGNKTIRVIVEKPILKELPLEKGTFEEVGRNLVIDEVIHLDN